MTPAHSARTTAPAGPAPKGVAGLAALHMAVLLFGFAGLFGKWVALPALWLVLGRTGFAAAVLALLAWAAHRRRVRSGAVGAAGAAGAAGAWCEGGAGAAGSVGANVSAGASVGANASVARPPAPALLLNGVLLAVHWLTFFQAIQVASVAIGLLGFASFPVFVLVLERVWLKVPVSARRAALAAVVTLGLVLLVPAPTLASAEVRGLLWGLASGLTFALLTLASRASVATRDATHVAMWQNVAAFGCLAPLALLQPATPTAAQWLLLAVLGVVCTALAHTLFIHSLKTVSAHTASVVAALEPVYGIALAVPLVGEVPSLRTLAGGALVVAAGVLATLDGRKPRRTHARVP